MSSVVPSPFRFSILGSSLMWSIVVAILLQLGATSTLFAFQGDSKGMKIERTKYGVTADGKQVDLITLTNAAGNQVQMTNYGAIIVSISVPDRKGEKTNVTLGFDKLEGYLQRHPYFGATVGRFCNRIAKGTFTLDDKKYTLEINNGPNHLHGGKVGFDALIWNAEELKTENSVGIRFTLESPDGQEGYPGTLKVIADYVWDNQSTLTLRFEATTDKPTHLNLTNHAYFNLGGWKGGVVHDHQMKLFCTKYLAVDDTMIPTGAIVDVAGTPMDFRQPHAIGERIAQLTATNGYDHCFVVEGAAGKVRPCASVVDPKSGRAMDVQTTQPGVQLYTGNFLSGSESNGNFKQHEAFCLETQHYPDAPNRPEFPSTLLKPNEKFEHTTTFRFYTVP